MNRTQWVLLFLRAAEGALLTSATVLVLYDPVFGLLQKAQMRNRLRSRQRLRRGKTISRLQWEQNMQLAFGRKARPEVFWAADAILFWSLWIPLLQLFSPVRAAVTALLGAAVPWWIYGMQLARARRRGSREGTLLVSELLRRYRLNGKNLFLAIEDTVAIPELKVTEPLLYRMLLELRETGEDLRVKNATESLAGTLKTNWSRVLAHNLQAAALTGRDMTAAMEDLLVQLRDAERLAEERKRSNGESARMVNWFIPLLYPFTLLLSQNYLGLPMGQVLRNQLTTPAGVTLLITIVFLWTANGAALSLLTGKKYDF